MFLERIYDESLAQAAYVVACDHTKLAVVIDANRDIESCIRVAEHQRFRVIAATETHIHADFVSGTREVARRTGARLLLSCEGGPGWQYAFATPDTTTLPVAIYSYVQFDSGPTVAAIATILLVLTLGLLLVLQRVGGLRRRAY